MNITKKIVATFAILILIFGAGTATMTVKAAEEHTVAFDPEDGTGYADFVKITVVDNELITEIPPAPSRLGYIFKGWAFSYDVDDNPIFWNFATMRVTENTTLWAEWEAGHIVAFDPENGTGYADFVKMTVADNELITEAPPVPTWPGHKFIGWAHAYDAEDNPMFWDFATMRVTENTTLWAEWAVEHIVAFDPNDGSTTYADFVKINVIDNGLITGTVPMPTRPGYEFAGWAYAYDAEDNPMFWDFATMRVTDNTTLWAEWTEATDVTEETDTNNTAATVDVLPVTGQDVPIMGMVLGLSGLVLLGATILLRRRK